MLNHGKIRVYSQTESKQNNWRFTIMATVVFVGNFIKLMENERLYDVSVTEGVIMRELSDAISVIETLNVRSIIDGVFQELLGATLYTGRRNKLLGGDYSYQKAEFYQELERYVCSDLIYQTRLKEVSRRQEEMREVIRLANDKEKLGRSNFESKKRRKCFMCAKYYADF